jgi:DNA-binding CsgD family transcriptional regulator/catechol 2,3-dioxygenase-like lactoylglutathione lyase family enzyme
MTTRRNRGRPPHDDVLTPAEWRVAEAVRHGLSNPAIAQRLGVSRDAVKYHLANILLKLALPGRTALRRWHGIRRDSALYGRKEHMDPLVTIGALGQIARTVTEIAAARRWYEGVLGLQHLYSFGTLSFFDCAGVRLMLSEGEGGPTDSILYFRVNDVHSVYLALQQRGVVFTHAPHRVHRHDDGMEEWMAFFQDNENRPLALMAQIQG